LEPRTGADHGNVEREDADPPRLRRRQRRIASSVVVLR
jgi:hypothetical protein